MRKIIVVTIAGLILASTAACGKYTERYKDADRGVSNSGPADTINFPDGFSNAATKCDHGNRVYVLFHEDANYGGIAVVPSDPTCK